VNFYQHQEQARKQTGMLIFFFIVAVSLIVLAINAVVFFAIFQAEESDMSLQAWIQSPICWITVAITLSVIIGGSTAKAVQLSNGGAAVAVMAGGNYLSPETKDPQRKQLINVVEEMAIASGVQVPQIFILEEEPGINAFVAGTSPNNAALAVTQGALDTFSRDELQGVIGHEFSHILNGDMNTNIKLISILAGILLIGKIGESLTRGSSFGHRRNHYRSSSYRTNNKDSDKGWIIGLALMAIGYIGLFFGRLIKAAISRQREFLADASAVQFTRNPSGIGQALFAIQAHQDGSLLDSPNAEDMIHLCFGEAIKVQFSGLLATHPPLDDRIKAIDPTLPARLRSRHRSKKNADQNTVQGKHTQSSLQKKPVQKTFDDDAIEFVNASFSGAGTSTANTTSVNNTNDSSSAKLAPTLKASIGLPTPEHTLYAQSLLANIPKLLLETAHSPAQADIIIYILILATMTSHGQEAMSLIKKHTDVATANKTVACYKLLKQHDERSRLPLLEIATQSLSQQSQEKSEKLVSLTQTLIALDDQFTLPEFIVFCLVKKHLLPNPKKNRTIKRYSAVFKEMQFVLAALSATSNKEGKIDNKAFHQAYAAFSSLDTTPILPTIQQLQISLEKLSHLSPLLKQPFIDACIDCILFDNAVSIREVELLRAICETLDCPMPPLTADKP